MWLARLYFPEPGREFNYWGLFFILKFREERIPLWVSVMMTMGGLRLMRTSESQMLSDGLKMRAETKKNNLGSWRLGWGVVRRFQLPDEDVISRRHLCLIGISNEVMVYIVREMLYEYFFLTFCCFEKGRRKN